MESEEGVAELRLREGNGELGEGVGDVDGWRSRIGDEVGEAEQADRSSFLRWKDQRRAVALSACLRWFEWWRRLRDR